MTQERRFYPFLTTVPFSRRTKLAAYLELLKRKITETLEEVKELHYKKERVTTVMKEVLPADSAYKDAPFGMIELKTKPVCVKDINDLKEKV